MNNFALAHNMPYDRGMISVIVPIEKNQAARLARTLENLVPYAIEGFVQQVYVIHDGLDDTTRVLCEEAGCEQMPADTGLRMACENARGEWLLFMEPGSKLNSGWADVVSAHAEANGGAAYFKIDVTGLGPFWKRMFFPAQFKQPLAKGLLISKRQARANLKSQTTPDGLIRGLALKRLNAEISPPVQVSSA